jgi:hypothetical protein
MKHLLNDLTEKEKNSIREQHTGGMKVVTENFSKLINTKSGDVKPLVNEQPSEWGRDSINRPGSFSNYIEGPGSIGNKDYNHDREIENTDSSDLEKEFDEFDEDSFSECDELIDTMKFIFKDFMDFLETLPDEFDEADAEDTYDELESQLGSILDKANQTECDDETIQHLEILYNEYLSEMANKLGLR